MLGTCGTEQEGTGRTRAYFARAFFWELTESPFHYGPRHVELARQVTNAEIQMVLYVVVFFIWHFTIFFFQTSGTQNSFSPVAYGPTHPLIDKTFLTINKEPLISL